MRSLDFVIRPLTPVARSGDPLRKRTSMLRPVLGGEALVSYIQTGDRDARIAYRELPDKERLAYRDMVNRVYHAAHSHHFGTNPSIDQVRDLMERLGARHPQYGGSVRRLLRSLAEGDPNGGINPRQILTAQHLIIREIAKLHPGFRERASRIVENASRAPGSTGTGSVGSGHGDAGSAEFNGADPRSAVSVTLRLDGTMHALELLRGAERLGGRTLGSSIVRAWVAAEKQRWRRAKELGMYDSFPEIGSGAGKGDTFRFEAYSRSRLCRATVDRHGRLRSITFMRTGLFGDDGRLGLAAQIHEAIARAQNSLNAEW